MPAAGEAPGDTGPQRQLKGWIGVPGPGHHTVLPAELLELTEVARAWREHVGDMTNPN